MTVRELVNLCKKDRPIKPPWVEDEEDRVFEGYENVVEMLEDIGVDTKKVNNHVLTAIRNIGESWGGGGWGQWMQPLPVHFRAVLVKIMPNNSLAPLGLARLWETLSWIHHCTDPHTCSKNTDVSFLLVTITKPLPQTDTPHM